MALVTPEGSGKQRNRAPCVTQFLLRKQNFSTFLWLQKGGKEK